jgi:hypothetical protein
MPPTPTGPISVAMSTLANLIAGMSWFQTWTGAGSQSAALASVFVGQIGLPISSIAAEGGVLTITTKEPHGLSASQTITIQGAELGPESDQSADGVYTVATVPSSTSVTVATSLGNFAATSIRFSLVFPGTYPHILIRNQRQANPAIGSGGAFVSNGTLLILMEADVSESYQNDPTSAGIESDNAVGSFMEQFMSIGDTGFYNLTAEGCTEFTQTSEQDDSTIRFERWRQVISCEWGLKG